MPLLPVSTWYSIGGELINFLDTTSPIIDREDLIIGVHEPTTDNTGVIPGSTLTAYSGSYTISSATTIEDKIISSRITINTTATVVFRNCLFNMDGFAIGPCVRSWAATAADCWFYDCTFQPVYPAHTNVDPHPSAPIRGIGGHGLRAIRCKFLHCVDAADTFDSDFNIADFLMQQCYIHQFAFWRPYTGAPEGTHNDGIQVAGGNDIQILGNAFHGYLAMDIGDGAALEGTGPYTATHGVEPQDWNTGDPNKKYINNSLIFMKPDNGDISGVVIDKNWFYGSTVPIHASDVGGTPQPDLIITNNKFGNPGTVDAGALNTPAEFGNAPITRANATVSGNTYFNGTSADGDI